MSSSEPVLHFQFFMATLTIHGSSQARDWIWVTDATYTKAVASLDLLTHCAMMGNEPVQILNPMSHSRNSHTFYFYSSIILLLVGRVRPSFIWIKSSNKSPFSHIILRLNLWHMEVPGPGVESELQLQTYATAMQDLSYQQLEATLIP